MKPEICQLVVILSIFKEKVEFEEMSQSGIRFQIRGQHLLKILIL